MPTLLPYQGPKVQIIIFLDDKVATISVKKVLGDNRAIMASVTQGPVLNIFAVDLDLKSSRLHCLNLSDPSKRRFPGNRVLNFKTMLLYETTLGHFPQFSFYSGLSSCKHLGKMNHLLLQFLSNF